MMACFDETEELRGGTVQQGVALCIRKKVTGKFFRDQMVRKRCNMKYFSDREFRRGDIGRVFSIHAVRRRGDEQF
jgi:hypothetical protein